MERQKTRKPAEGQRQAIIKMPAWFLLWAVVLGILLPFSFILFLHLPVVQQQVINYLIKQVTVRTGLQPSVAGYRWLPFSGLHLQSLEVRSEGGLPILQCEKAELSYRFSLQWPYIEPKELFLEKPSLHLERGRDGTWQIPQPKPAGDKLHPSGLPSWADFPWPKLKIYSGTIIAQQEGKTILSVRDVTGSLVIKTTAEGKVPTLQLDFDQWHGQFLSPDLGICRIQGEASYRDGTLSTHGLVLNIGEDSKLSCQGLITVEPELALNIKVDLERLNPAIIPEVHAKLPFLREISGLLTVMHTGNSWHIDHDLRTDRGKLCGAFEMQVSDGVSCSWATQFADVDIAVAEQTPSSSLAGRFEMDFKAKDLRSLTGKGRMRLEPSGWGEHVISSGEINATYNQGVLNLKTDDLRTSFGTFSLNSFADILGAWELQHSGVIRLDCQTEQASLDKVISGLKKNAEGRVHLEALYGAGKFYNIASWQGKVEGDFNVPGFLSLKVSGNYKDELLQADYDLNAVDAESVKIWYPEWQGRGAVKSRGTFKGKWPDLLWEGELSSPKFQYGEILSEGLSVKGKSKIAGKAGPRNLVVKAQKLTMEGRHLGPLTLDLTQHDDTCKFLIRGDQCWDLSNFKFSGSLDGLWAFPRTVSIDQGQFTWKEAVTALEGKLQLTEQQLIIHSLSLSQNKQKAHLSGHVSYDSASDLQCSLEGINVGQLLKLCGSQESLSGLASGQVRLTGGPERPEIAMNLQVFNASMRVDKALLDQKRQASKELKDFEPIDQLQVQGHYLGDNLQLQGEMRYRSAESPVTFSARVPMQFSMKPFRVHLNQSGEFTSNVKINGLEAESLLRYMNFLEKLGGHIEGDAQIAGSLGQPVVKAAGKWRDGKLTLKTWPHPIEDIQLEFVADSKRLQITRGDVRLLSGSATIKGAIDYRGDETAVLEAEGQNVEVPEFLGISGTVSGRARLMQTSKGPVVTGDFRASKAGMNLGQFEKSLARNIDIIDGDEQGDLVVVRDTEKREGKYFNQLKLDLAVELPPSKVYVKGMGLDAEVTGSLKIEKPAFESIRLNGMLQTVKGTYTFQGNALKIVDGQLVFLGTPKPDPHLRIVCQKEVRDVLLQVQVTGPLSRPKMNLSSVPAMNQMDILSYLLYDQPAGELGTKETFQLQNRATAWLSSETSKALKSMLGNNRLAPDTVEYKSADSLDDWSSWSQTNKNTLKKEEGGVVEIGKYITPDLHVSYEKGVMGEERNQVQLEYRFNRRLSVQTQVGGVQSSGVDVFWRHDFD